MEPWYKSVQPRAEVREGRSFNPDEFAIALEQVAAGNAPDDYKDPIKFFARTCFTRALNEHAGMVIRRLSGETSNAAPVLTLVTQFGGGKTHTLTALYHLIRNSRESATDPGVQALLKSTGLSQLPTSKVAIFVGNAWDPTEGRETPWIDFARQLAGDAGVTALGTEARTTPPGTEAIGRIVEKAGGSVLILFDEVLNYLNRYRDKADSFHAFIQNLTVAMTGTTRSAAVISLPRSQVEMAEWDSKWQERITKVVKRVAKDLLVNDEAEIGEVVRRRLFDDIGKETTRRTVALAYANWCFEHRAELPPEWTAVDSAATEAKARDYLRSRFEACYPFHPATLTVFQRKWRTLPQFQQTRGTLAMFAQWISVAFAEDHRRARTEPLITLGSAPLDVPSFRAVVLGQLGEMRLDPGINSDIAGEQNKAAALDADTSKGPPSLKGIHRRVGTAILFESSGGQSDQTAHLPELRFALGEPETDTTSIDTAAFSLETKGFYIRKAGTDGFRFGFKPTLKKVVSDRRASLDEEEVKKATRLLVRKEFERDANVPVEPFPPDSSAVEDSPRLRVVILDPVQEWNDDGALRKNVAEWTKLRGKSPRLYPASLVWCARKPGRELRDKIENWLAWQRVQTEIASGALAGDFDTSEKDDIRSKLRDAEGDARDEVWASYRYLAMYDGKETDGVRAIDLGAGHSSSGKSLCGRVLAAMTSQSLLNASVGAGYLDRRWPQAFKESGAWPLKSLRQAFLDGSLDRLIDPDQCLRERIPDFVTKGDFGLASGGDPATGFSKIWFKELMRPDEVAFDSDVYLLTGAKAKALKLRVEIPIALGEDGADREPIEPEGSRTQGPVVGPAAGKQQIRIAGTIPPEVWNRLGTKLIPKLKAGTNLRLGLAFSLEIEGAEAHQLISDLRQAIEDLGLSDALKIDRS